MFCCGLAGLHVRRNDDVAICLSILSVEARRYPLAGENESTNPLLCPLNQDRTGYSGIGDLPQKKLSVFVSSIVTSDPMTLKSKSTIEKMNSATYALHSSRHKRTESRVPFSLSIFSVKLCSSKLLNLCSM